MVGTSILGSWNSHWLGYVCRYIYIYNIWFPEWWDLWCRRWFLLGRNDIYWEFHHFMEWIQNMVTRVCPKIGYTTKILILMVKTMINNRTLQIQDGWKTSDCPRFCGENHPWVTMGKFPLIQRSFIIFCMKIATLGVFAPIAAKSIAGSQSKMDRFMGNFGANSELKFWDVCPSNALWLIKHGRLQNPPVFTYGFFQTWQTSGSIWRRDFPATFDDTGSEGNIPEINVPISQWNPYHD